MSDIRPLDYMRAVRDSRNLSPAQRLTAMVVATHAGPEGADAHPGEKLLAAETGLSEKTVRGHLRVLREQGWLSMHFSGRGGDRSKASAYHLLIPTSSGYRLNDAGDGVQPVVSDRSTGNQGMVQPVVSDRSTGNGYRTNALRDAPINACSDVRAREARAADQPRLRRTLRARQDQPRFIMRDISVPEPEYYPEPDISPGLQPPALVSGNEPEWE